MKKSRLLGACACTILLTTFNTTVIAAPASPFLETGDSFLFEDGSGTIAVWAALGNTDGSEFLTVTITGLEPSWTVDANGGTYNQITGTWTFTALPGVTIFTGGPGITPPADSDVDMTGLTVTATSTETATGETDSVNGDIDVYVDAVADVPNVVVADAFGTVNTPIDLNLAAFVTDTDGSEAITDIFLSSLPGGSSLSAGSDLGSGLWQLTTAELIGLTLTPTTGVTGMFSLMMDASAEESVSDIDFATGNDIAMNSASFNVTVSAVPLPAAVWLFGSGLLGLIGIARRKAA